MLATFQLGCEAANIIFISRAYRRLKEKWYYITGHETVIKIANITSQICSRNACAIFYWYIFELHPPSSKYSRRDVWEGLIRNAGCWPRPRTVDPAPKTIDRGWRWSNTHRLVIKTNSRTPQVQFLLCLKIYRALIFRERELPLRTIAHNEWVDQNVYI